jgi:hypothetical protein
MRMWLVVNVGIMTLIVAGCATAAPVRQSARGRPSTAAATGQTAAPRALAALSCGAGQRIESPDVARIRRVRWWSVMNEIYPFVFPLPSLVGTVATLAHPPIEDLTPEFRKSIGAILEGVDLQQLLLSRAEQGLEPRPPCETAYVATSWDKPDGFQPSDKVVGIGFYFIFTANVLQGRPTVTACLSAMVMTGENAAELAMRAAESGKILEEMKKLEPYVRVYDRRPDLGKLRQYAALSQKLGAGLTPYIDGAGTFQQDSPDHSTDEWVADGGKLAIQEIAALMDRLLAELGQALFKSP